MPKISNKLRIGDYIFISTYQAIGIIERIETKSAHEMILKVDHYLRNLSFTHKTQDIDYVKIKNRAKAPKYENFEIYNVVTRILKEAFAFDRKSGKKLYELNTGIERGNQRIGQALILTTITYQYNPRKLKFYPGIGKNTCRQTYWIEK